MMARRTASAGFTYLGLLLLVAVLGIFLGGIGEFWRTAQRREAERDLRFIGEEFRRAIGRYYESTPGPVKMYPRSLKVLLNDDRYPGTRRYLRRIYRDPITLGQEWGLVDAPEGGITGVYSLSEAEPFGQIKPGTTVGRTDSAGAAPAADTTKAGTKEEERKERYSDWKFVYTPTVQSPPPPPPAGAAPFPGGAPPAEMPR